MVQTLRDVDNIFQAHSTQMMMVFIVYSFLQILKFHRCNGLLIARSCKKEVSFLISHSELMAMVALFHITPSLVMQKTM